MPSDVAVMPPSSLKVVVATLPSTCELSPRPVRVVTCQARACLQFIRRDDTEGRHIVWGDGVTTQCNWSVLGPDGAVTTRVATSILRMRLFPRSVT